MNFIDGVFFFYTFVSLYMLFLFVLIYIPNRKELFAYPKGKIEPVSIVVPCYNEGKHIGETIESLLNLNYPRDMYEIIVVDDLSKDNSAEVVRQYARKYKNVRLIVNKRNSGGAAEPTNIGIRAAKYKYIAVTDADSTPDRDNLIKMIGFLQNDKKVGAVTCSVLAKKPENFMQKLQDIEYKIIVFNRKLLDLVDGVYVTPGPFALYRKETLMEVGLFDTKNLTQDIEIVWKLIKHGYIARMCLDAKVYSATPRKFGQWWRQRVRWSLGGNQTLWKYKRYVFRSGMLGLFVIPFFSFSLFLGLFGLGLFIYLIIRRLLVSYLSTKYSIYAGTAVLRMQELSFSPSILNFFGASLLIIGLAVSLYSLRIMETRWNKNIFNILFFQIVYLSLFPLIVLVSIYKGMRGKHSW